MFNVQAVPGPFLRDLPGAAGEDLLLAGGGHPGRAQDMFHQAAQHRLVNASHFYLSFMWVTCPRLINPCMSML